MRLKSGAIHRQRPYRCRPLRPWISDRSFLDGRGDRPVSAVCGFRPGDIFREGIAVLRGFPPVKLGIYNDEIRNWSEVGGAREPIRVFQRPENSGSQTMLQKMMVKTVGDYNFKRKNQVFCRIIIYR